jgi:hypothetical protein
MTILSRRLRLLSLRVDALAELYEKVELSVTCQHDAISEALFGHPVGAMASGQATESGVCSRVTKATSPSPD